MYVDSTPVHYVSLDRLQRVTEKVRIQFIQAGAASPDQSFCVQGV